MPSNAASTRFALLAAQVLIRNGERNAQGGGWQLPVGNAIRNHFDGETLCFADRFFPSLAVGHHAGRLKSFGDPAAVFFAIQINRQLHPFIMPARQRELPSMAVR